MPGLSFDQLRPRQLVTIREYRTPAHAAPRLVGPGCSEDGPTLQLPPITGPNICGLPLRILTVSVPFITVTLPQAVGPDRGPICLDTRYLVLQSFSSAHLRTIRRFHARTAPPHRRPSPPPAPPPPQVVFDLRSLFGLDTPQGPTP